MAVKSLNDAIKQGTYKRLCNSRGDLLDPNDVSSVCKTGELHRLWTQEEIALNANFLNVRSDVRMYVLRLADDTAAMGLSFPFSVGWCKETLEYRQGKKDVTEKEVKETWMPRLYRMISEAAKRVIQKAVPSYDIYVGENTDPDGHEMMVVIPYKDRDDINGTIRMLHHKVYQAVEELFDKM